jgi:hypothetical protein
MREHSWYRRNHSSFPSYQCATAPNRKNQRTYSVGYVITALTDAFHGVGIGRNVEQALIGVGILHDSRCFALHRKHHGALALLELFHEVAGTSAEGCQRLDVLGDVQHGPAPVKYLSTCWQNTPSL